MTHGTTPLLVPGRGSLLSVRHRTDITVGERILSPLRLQAPMTRPGRRVTTWAGEDQSGARPKCLPENGIDATRTTDAKSCANTPRARTSAQEE